MKKLLALLLAAAMVLSMAACNPSDGTTGSTNKPSGMNPDATGGVNASYTVTVQSMGKMPLANIDVQVFLNGELQNVARTDANGVAAFTLPRNDKYTIALNNVPKGYLHDESYSFSGNTAMLFLKSAPIDADITNATLTPGNIMTDFTVTDVDGNKHTLSELLKENKVVILNLYFNQCGPCVTEMPFMNQAYEMFKDKGVEIIAVNPQGGAEETEAKCEQFRDELGLAFPVCKVNSGWMNVAIDQKFPTTYIIDRYGMIAFAAAGTEPNLRTWTSIMEHFTADDYQQKVISGMDEIVSRVEPDVEPMKPEDIGAVVGNANGNIEFSNDAFGTGDPEEHKYNWPFVSTEKDGQNVLHSTNKGIESAYSILYTKVTLKKGQAFGFDYLISSEAGSDILHVIVNDTPIFTISGNDTNASWKSAYPWVAQTDGVYEISFAYIKDGSNNAGEDTAYLKNFRILDDASQIDTETFLPQEAAVTEDGFDFEYVQIVFNEEDGYYHVGTKDGPLLLASLMTVSQLFPDNAVYLMAYDGFFKYEGKDYLKDIEPYASYAAYSMLPNYCTVDKGLADLLKLFVKINGFDPEDENEWLKLCKYYAAYGTNGAQLEDPIKGLATFSALKAELGKNEFYYEGNPIMPRGKLAKFTPAESGVYRITTTIPKEQNPDLFGFIFPNTAYHHTHLTDDKSLFYEHEPDERTYHDYGNISMVYYMEAGKSYFIDICFYDPYAVGTIPYEIEYLGAEYDMFRLASLAYFVPALLPDGEIDPGNLVAGGIQVTLGKDGYMYEVRGTDANGEPILGSKLYWDLIASTLTELPFMDYEALNEAGEKVTVPGNISLGGFNFTYSAEDAELVRIIKRIGTNDRAAVEAELKKTLGEASYDELVVNYKLDEFFAGIYHGIGNNRDAENQKYLAKLAERYGFEPTRDADGYIAVGDVTERILTYVDQRITEKNEAEGCVLVDGELAFYLQLFVDTYSFDGVEDAFTKLCYYYDHMGPA